MNTVAILLSTYNGEKYILDQLRSLENQSYLDFDLYIRDDASSDNTVTLIKQFQSQSNLSIIFLPTEINLGAKDSFAYLLKHSIQHLQYEYFMFCDQDDVWLPKKIELTLKKILEVEKFSLNTPLLIHTNLKVVNTNLDILSNSYWHYQHIDPSKDALNQLLLQNTITGCTVMINKKLANLVFLIPHNVIMHDWWLGLVAASFGQIHHIDTPTMLYRQHSNNDTGATSFNFNTILKKFQNLSNINLNKYIIQAEELLSHYSEDLNTEQKELLEAFIYTRNQLWIQSKQTLLKYKILKQDIFRNIGLLLCKNR